MSDLNLEELAVAAMTAEIQFIVVKTATDDIVRTHRDLLEVQAGRPLTLKEEMAVADLIDGATAEVAVTFS